MNPYVLFSTYSTPSCEIHRLENKALLMSEELQCFIVIGVIMPWCSSGIWSFKKNQRDNLLPVKGFHYSNPEHSGTVHFKEH